MAVLPTSTPSRARILPEELFLVGPEALVIRPALEEFIAAASPGRGPVISAIDSLFETVLIAGDRENDDRTPTDSRLFISGISREVSHLEAAIGSLRRVNPDARIILLCDPAEEVLCRKARAWGADDYCILPLDARSLRQIFAFQIPAPAAAGPTRDARLMQGHAARVQPRTSIEQRGKTLAKDAPLPAIPLIVQTELLDDLFAGHPDFAHRAIASLSRHIDFQGRLHFHPGPDEPAAGETTTGEIRRSVTQPGQAPFGTLLLDTTQHTPATIGVVAQAANWLAGMLTLSRKYEQLRSLAITDELSGAYNRRYFMKFMSGLLEQAKDKRSRVTLLLFDIDDFKQYNDRFGHASGDAIIRELIKLLRACTRPYDLVARIGGDEFAVVYRDNEAPRQPNSEHPKDVLVATERFREAIRNHQWPQACNIKSELSISGGLATFPWDADSLELLMAKADAALLRAKAAGKNVIVMHVNPVETLSADPALTPMPPAISE